MRCPSRRSFQGLVFGLASLLILAQCTDSDSERTDRAPPPGDRVAHLPRPTDYFVENVGQVENRDVLFYHAAGGMQIGFAQGAILLKVLEPDERSSPVAPNEQSPAPAGMPQASPQVENLERIPPAPAVSSSGPGLHAERGEVSQRGVLVRITFDGSNLVAPQGLEEMPARSHYFLGNNPAGWQTDVRSYRDLIYQNIYDGVDLVCRSHADGLKYEFKVQAGADPTQIHLTWEGVEILEVGASGDMILRTEIGEMRDAAPSAFQGAGEGVSCRFVPRGPLSYGFECDGWDPRRPLVIDPLVYSTFLGGSAGEMGHGVALDARGNIYIVGWTGSSDFPTTPGAFDTSRNGNQDVFVSGIDPSGRTLLYSTFLGGSRDDRGYGIAVDPAGNAYVTGEIHSSDFPITPGAFDTSHNTGGNADGFIAKVSASGGSLIYSSFLGGSLSNLGFGIAVDGAGNAYVTGRTSSLDFPTTLGAFDASHNGGLDVFVAKVDSSGGSLLYGTLLGGSSADIGRAIAVDGAGNAYVAGGTQSPDFPTTPGAFDTSLDGNSDAFVAELDSSGGNLLYSTVLGGSSGDGVGGIAVDGAGDAYITGATASSDFPTTAGAFDTSLDGIQDVFVAKVDSSGGSLLYGTLLGGSSADTGSAIAVDAAGNAYVGGWTQSPDFPTTTGASDASHNGLRDSFVVKIDPSGGNLIYGTFIGGGSNDEGKGIAVDGVGNAFVTGATYSSDFPRTTGAFDTSFDGSVDVFVAKVVTGAASSCPRSQGFWKNQPADWPVLTLSLGSETYDQAELIALLKTPPRGDASLILAKQLIAAKLNIKNGSDPSPVSAEIADADALLATPSGKLPYDVHASTPTGGQMVNLASVLDDYNNELLTSGCTR